VEKKLNFVIYNIVTTYRRNEIKIWSNKYLS